MSHPSGHVVEQTATPSVAPTPNGGILIATDGAHESDGSVRVGLALARRDSMPIEMLSVVEPLPLYDTDAIAIPDTDRLVRMTRESRDAALEAQRERTHPGAREWPYRVETGPRVEAIVAAAERGAASLIVLGIGSHGPAARLFQRETALRVIRAARIPVLAVPEHAWGVPHSALVAIDFTTSSERAAQSAIDLLGGEGMLYLAHATARVPIPGGDPRTWEEATRGVLPRLEVLASRLTVPAGVQVEYVSLHGEPAHELLAFAEQHRIDLVAAGAHGRTSLSRFFLGSVSTKLVRHAQCCVLVAPPCRDEAPAPDRTSWT